MSDFENSSFICKGNDLYTNYASAIGTAVGLSSIGGKTGVATDGSRAAKSAAYSIMGALSSASSRVWDFGESFYAQFQYLVKFCSLDSGIFISRKNAQTVISMTPPSMATNVLSALQILTLQKLTLIFMRKAGLVSLVVMNLQYRPKLLVLPITNLRRPKL